MGLGGGGGEGEEKNYSLTVSDVKSFENVDGRYILFISGAFSLNKLLID